MRVGGSTPQLSPKTLHCAFTLSLKPSETPELDEDEGFGDWSQKPEQQQQPWGTKGSADSSNPPWGKCPEREQEEDRQVEIKFWGLGFWTAAPLTLSPYLCLSSSLCSPFPTSPHQKPPWFQKGTTEGREEGNKTAGRPTRGCSEGAVRKFHSWAP